MAENVKSSATAEKDPTKRKAPNWRPLRRTLTYFPELKLVYMRNAKSGTRTFLRTLTRTAKQHPVAKTPGTRIGAKRTVGGGRSIGAGLLGHATPDEIVAAQFFTVVRHPLVRLVSGFLNKIGTEHDQKVWNGFCSHYGLERDRRLTFPEFVALIHDDDPQKVDRHFRAQWINVSYGLIPFAHIGQLEDLQPTADFLNSIGVGEIVSFQKHATNANSTYMDFYSDPETLKKAVEMFEKDFERFNYAPDVQNVVPLGPAAPNPGMPEKLKKILTNTKAKLEKKPAAAQEAS